jgi:hypothetical protein
LQWLQWKGGWYENVSGSRLNCLLQVCAAVAPLDVLQLCSSQRVYNTEWYVMRVAISRHNASSGADGGDGHQIWMVAAVAAALEPCASLLLSIAPG